MTPFEGGAWAVASSSSADDSVDRPTAIDEYNRPQFAFSRPASLDKKCQWCDHICLPKHFTLTPGSRGPPEVCLALGVSTPKRRTMAVRIGELLLKEKRITPAQ